jgi:nitrite reductase/ring-hydroxylating ferredoxin subunit/DMSO/TMAO reductase YedYZ heme-binding membrane subunit
MSVGFRAIQWNRAKIVYDVAVVAFVVTFVGVHMALGYRREPPGDAAAWIDLRINALGACAFTMITIILCIGPLARLDRRFLPLLYNRRHFGVIAFCVALAHGVSVFDWFWVQGSAGDFVAELTTGANYTKFIGFTTKAIGLTALMIFFVMAATSHDYWQAFLGPAAWKSLHMAIYPAYGLLVMHVSLGMMQEDRSPLIPALLLLSFGLVAGLHIAAGRSERKLDRAAGVADGWIVVGPPEAIPDKAATIVLTEGGERIAVFRDGATISAMTNVCAHQNGPLGEGRVVNGCAVCPWHQWEYQLADGCAPAPFTEKIATYRARLRDGRIEVDPKPLPPGTPAALVLDGSAKRDYSAG